MKRLLASIGLLSALTLGGCDTKSGTTGFDIPMSKDLEPGGVYVVYNHGCTKGCDQIEKGDLIQKIDGKAVSTGADFDAANVIDGQPHQLEVRKKDGSTATVEIVASPKTDMPPLENVPPFWTSGAARLNQAPEWARRRMFGHASPMAMLVNTDGGIFDGRQLHGKKHLMVYWDRGDREEQAAAVALLQVLQKAQPDLKAKDIDIMYIQLQFPTGRQVAMNDSDLREFQKKWTVEQGGQKLAPIPMYRFPNKTEFNEARQLGMENAYTVFENLGKSPVIVLLDERGVVRWNSEGLQQPPAGAQVADPAQYTIIEAVEFALNKL
ncbi:hypothetical protein [Paraliomyxa miuraensis]|uniref:hypothetical protein n=1 Tax=Paraliomyxa miuraensis TaxID=376150 RepID=UPI00224E5B8F|nr:hypothetical protein [Paraliomyxa miuraensis]MCX4247600.1 hypothetical protein [Paraliomyxa miuraensis]